MAPGQEHGVQGRRARVQARAGGVRVPERSGRAEVVRGAPREHTERGEGIRRGIRGRRGGRRELPIRRRSLSVRRMLRGIQRRRGGFLRRVRRRLSADHGGRTVRVRLGGEHRRDRNAQRPPPRRILRKFLLRLGRRVGLLRGVGVVQLVPVLRVGRQVRPARRREPPRPPRDRRRESEGPEGRQARAAGGRFGAGPVREEARSARQGGQGTDGAGKEREGGRGEA
mmetsp:Transcript_53502/g.160100  ORF Transcript_53502/g.160100 Transcript_53502/m.160100 type:complete len:226 (-) Transcript_53502:772-1449(-)